MSTLPASANVKALLGFDAPTVHSPGADVPQMGTRGSLKKNASRAQELIKGFRNEIGYRDWLNPEHPNGVSHPGPRGY